MIVFVGGGTLTLFVGLLFIFALGVIMWAVAIALALLWVLLWVAWRLWRRLRPVKPQMLGPQRPKGPTLAERLEAWSERVQIWSAVQRADIDRKERERRVKRLGRHHDYG